LVGCGGLVLSKSAGPLLVEFLRGKSSRCIKIRDGQYEVELTGASPEKAIEIFDMLRNKNPKFSEPADSRDRLESPITVTLRDSETVVSKKE
jgi:hypothetical protein